MEPENLGNWLLACLVFSLQATMVYAIGRVIWLGGGLALNPFQPGWGTLAARYGTSQPLPRMQSASARVGATTYKNTLRLAFGPDALFLEKSFLGTSCLRIPYGDLQVAQPPRRHTILRIPFRTDGLFEAVGVSLALPTNEARALIEELAYAQLARAEPTAAAAPR